MHVPCTDMLSCDLYSDHLGDTGTSIHVCTVLHCKRVDFFSRVACRLVFFHRSQKTPRRHTKKKTFCLASAVIVHKAAYKYVCIDDAH